MVKKKTTKPLTREETIAQLWKNHENEDRSITPFPPDNRRLSVGDELKIGHLEDCVVADLSADGRFAVIDHTRTEREGHEMVRKEHLLRIWPWHECIPKVERVSDFARPKPLRPGMMNSDLSSIIHKVLTRGVVDNPDYQRGYAWTLDDKRALIESIFAERTIGTFLFVDMPFERYRGKLEVLDGKQRLDAIVGFYTSQFDYNGKFYHELSDMDMYRFGNIPVQFAHLDGERLKKAELLQLFLDVNQAGVPQTPEHLDKVKAMLEQELSNGKKAPKP